MTSGADDSTPDTPHRAGLVAVVGRPNVGKSTLLNQLLKLKLAAVSPKPQTTRRRILGVLSGQGYQAAFLDTPGRLARPRDALDRHMLRESREAISDADVVVLVVEPRPPGDTERLLAREIQQVGRPALVAINKIDTVRKSRLLPVMEEYHALHSFLEVVPISALNLDGVDLLLDLVVKHLPQGEPLFPPDQITDRSQEFLVAELIREKVCQLYRQELPHATAVAIETFRPASEEHGGKTYVYAIIYPERDTQRRILIGQGGQALKQVGVLARQEIEALLGQPVHLELWVKSRPGWRKDPAFLRELDY